MDKYINKVKNFKTSDIKKLLPFFILIVVLVIGKNLIGMIKGIFGNLNKVVVGEDEVGTGSGVSQTEVVVDVESLTYPENNYIMWADQLEQGFYATYLTEDDELVGQILRYMQNDTDVANLVKKYGVRDGGSWFNTNYNLPQAVSAMLDNDIKNAVNQNYQSKGISFRF
jgi:hypothetical protein